MNPAKRFTRRRKGFGMNSTFCPLEIQTGLLLDLSDDEFPTQVWGWNGGNLSLADGATYFGMVTAGRAKLHWNGETFPLRAGMFWVLPHAGIVESEADGRGLVVARLDYRGLFQIGGPVELTGRLRYIDGCSDTLLVCPPVLGEPCLNHLHLPPHTRQSAHTHPSTRVGVILGGQGECRTPDGTFALAPGMAWYIPTGCLHSFFTTETALDVLAWHPDSDFGPTHENHPMINRTVLKSPSARSI
jgi:quercetin dioxygenase-like cupin family protein